MLTAKIYQSTIQLLMLIIISQVALMNIGNLQLKQYQSTVTTSASMPCPKAANLKLSANKICENYAKVFLNMGSAALSLIHNKAQVFFAFVALFAYPAPIYSIYKPPKISF